MFHFVSHEGPSSFLERAERWLLRREDRHNLPLSLAYARRGADEVGADALFATVQEGDRVVGCVIRTPPHKVLVTEIPPGAAGVVAEGLAGRYETVPAFLGPARSAEAIADAWVAAMGGSWHAGMRQRMYRADRIQPPEGVAGALRLVVEDDIGVAVEWANLFADHVGHDHGIALAGVQRLVARQELFFWLDGEPVSMVAAQGRTPHGCRIGYVFTPDVLRGRGYASAATAAASQRMLNSGMDFCVLYTDLANPTSNAIYQRIGYRPIGDVRDVVIVSG